MQTAGAGAFIALFASGAQANLLTNGTFEANDAFPGAVSCPPTNCDGWTAFESVFTKANVDQFNNFGPVSHDAGGTQSLQMFGPFTLNPNASGAYQAVDSVAAGTPYNATAYAMNWAPDTLTNIGIFQLSFWDAPGGQDGGGNNLGTFEVTLDSTTNPLAQDVSLAPQDGADISDWTQLSISQTAPAGTASAQVFLLHIQTDPVSGGSLFWDDVSLTAVPVPAAVWLFGSGLLGLVGVARRRRS